MKRSRFTMSKDTTKTCKICTADYLESENFKWSCRTHKSEYSGEMYWCCGKANREALGCKFDIHQARNDDLEEDEQTLEGMQGLARKQSKQVCKCCKETGHAANKCENDPNYHTVASTDLVDLQ